MGLRLQMCLLFWFGGVCVDAERRVFKHGKELDDTSPANSQHIKERMTDATPVQCSRECLKLGWCLSFYYQASDRQCLFLDQYMSYGNITAGGDAVGNQYWEEQCPDGFLQDPDSRYCLLILRDVTYDDAMKACQLRHSRLIVFDSLDKLETIRNILLDREETADTMFVNGRRADNATNLHAFEFSSGEWFPFASASSVWQAGQPNNDGGNQLCLVISPVNSGAFDPLRLHDIPCHKVRDCICERG